jgi:hypothetical protein
LAKAHSGFLPRDEYATHEPATSTFFSVRLKEPRHTQVQRWSARHTPNFCMNIPNDSPATSSIHACERLSIRAFFAANGYYYATPQQIISN